MNWVNLSISESELGPWLNKNLLNGVIKIYKIVKLLYILVIRISRNTIYSPNQSAGKLLLNLHHDQQVVEIHITKTAKVDITVLYQIHKISSLHTV